MAGREYLIDTNSREALNQLEADQVHGPLTGTHQDPLSGKGFWFLIVMKLAPVPVPVNLSGWTITNGYVNM